MKLDERITFRMSSEQRYLLLMLADEIGKNGNESAGFRELCGRYQKASQELAGVSTDALAGPVETPSTPVHR